MSNFETEYAHNRLDKVESALARLINNPAPTVPKYDLSFGVLETITDIKAYIYKNSSPTDDAQINICADDDDGTVPGSILGSVTHDGIVGGGLCDFGAPDPPISFSPGDNFWLFLTRTGTLTPRPPFTPYYPAGGYYACAYGSPDAPTGFGRAGINDASTGLPGDGFQWQDSAGVWWAFTKHVLGINIYFDNGNIIDNNAGSGGSGIAFGNNDTTSYVVAAKFIAP